MNTITQRPVGRLSTDVSVIAVVIAGMAGWSCGDTNRKPHPSQTRAKVDRDPAVEAGTPSGKRSKPRRTTSRPSTSRQRTTPFVKASHCETLSNRHWSEGTVVTNRSSWKGFTISVTVTPRAIATLQVHRKGRLLYQTRTGFLSHQIGSAWGCSHEMSQARLDRLVGSGSQKENQRRLLQVRSAAKWLRPGSDFTGNGRPNFVVFAANFGSHSPTNVLVFELKPRVRKVVQQELHVQPRDSAVRDVDGDGYPEFVMEDTLEDPNCHGLLKLRGSVILKLRGNRFRPSRRLMKKPPWPPARLAAEAMKHRSASSWPKPPNVLIEKAIDLIYSGNAKQSLDLIKRSWRSPKKPDGLYQSLVWILKGDKHCAGSPYYKLLLRLNDGAL